VLLSCNGCLEVYTRCGGGMLGNAAQQCGGETDVVLATSGLLHVLGVPLALESCSARSSRTLRCLLTTRGLPTPVRSDKALAM
jgi:hypothetical protein